MLYYVDKYCNTGFKSEEVEMDEIKTMDLIKAKEAGQILGVDRTTVWRWTEDGRLKAAVRAGQESFYERAYIEGVAQERANRRNKKERSRKGSERGDYKFLLVSPRGIRKEVEIYQVNPEDPEDMAKAVEVIESFAKEGSVGYAKWVSRKQAHDEVSHNRSTAQTIGESGLPVNDILIGAWGIDDIADYAVGRKAGYSPAPPMYLLVNPNHSRSEVNVYRVDPNDEEQLEQASKLVRSYAPNVRGVKGGYVTFTTEKDARAQVKANQQEARKNKPVGSTEIIDFGEHLAKQKKRQTAPLEPLADTD